jgi:transposase, IS6 family
MACRAARQGQQPRRSVTKNAAHPKAVADLKRDKRLWRFSKLRQIKYLNNIVE